MKRYLANRESHLGNLLRELALIAVLFVVLISSLAKAEETDNPNASSSALSTSEETIKEIRDWLVTSTKEKLLQKSEDFLGQRLLRREYLVFSELAIDDTKFNTLLKNWGPRNTSLLKKHLATEGYEDLRKHFSRIAIRVQFSDTLAKSESDAVFENFKEYFARDGQTNFETFESTVGPLFQDPLTEKIRKEAEAQKALIEFKHEKERAMSEITASQAERRLKQEYELKRQLRDFEKESAESELENERKKRFELSELMSEKFNAKDYILRQMPALSRFFAAGTGIGILAVIAGLTLGVFLILAAQALGKSLRAGVSEMTVALQDSFPAPPPPAKVDNKNEEQASDEEKETDSAIEFENKPELKEAAEKLKEQIQRDINTAAVALSQVAESGKYGEVIAIFDVLGADLSKSIFELFTSGAKVLMQRAFYTGSIKRPTPSALFNRINEIRAMLASTNVMLGTKHEKEFAQIILSYSDDEIAQSLDAIPTDQVLSMVSGLPVERMLAIFRKLPKESAEVKLRALAKAVESGSPAKVESFIAFSQRILDEKRMRFEQNRKYLQLAIESASEEEAQKIIDGLRHNPKLQLAVVGIRATPEDLWAQSIEILERLTSELELELVSGLLHMAPESLQEKVIANYPERKQALARDVLANINSNKAYAEELAGKVSKALKSILVKLADLAKAGTVVLPSYEELRQKAKEQEEAERAQEDREGSAEYESIVTNISSAS